MNRKDIEDFFKTLILGDFEENQNFAGQIVGGIISLIPIVDQVMDARDISGALYRINKQGGFNNATTNQLVNLGFAAFGAVPEVGSAFKTVFKPMWKERNAVKGAVNGGLQAVERMLGAKKGGTIVWVRVKVLGQWASLTSQAIVKVNLALDACIELLDTIGHLKGWKDYLVPDSIQALALELLPSMRRMKSGVTRALERASAEIRHFLEDLLGEQVATVVMAAGQRAVAASAAPGARTRAGHNAAAIKPRGTVPPRQPPRNVGGKPALDSKPGRGRVHAIVRATSRTIKSMATREKGLIGEHMVDYIEMSRLGTGWPHDTRGANKWTGSAKKVNAPKRPISLHLADLPQVNRKGMDSVWDANRKITISEAKASPSIGAAMGFGKYKESKGWIPTLTGLVFDHRLLHYLLTDYEDKGGGTGGGMVQMSTDWCSSRATSGDLPKFAQQAIISLSAQRRVVFVTLEAEGGLDHAEALLEINVGVAQKDLHPHITHKPTKAWDGDAIDMVVAARRKARALKAPGSKATKATKSRP